MRIEDIKYFIAICHYGSLNKAAKALNISQQGLSRTIKNLETYTGAELFVRHIRGVELTPFGEGFLKEAEKLETAAMQLEDYVKANAPANNKTLRVGLRLSFNASPVSSAINSTVEDFAQAHKEISVELLQRSQEELIDALKNGTIDVAQVMGPVDHNSFDVYPVVRQRLYIIASKAMGLDSEKQYRIRDLKDLPIIVPNRDNELCKIIISLYNDSGIDPQIIKYEVSAKTLTHLVHKGLGLGFMPEISVDAACGIYPGMGRYELIPETFFDYSFITLKGREKNRYVADLINFSNERVEGNVIPDVL